MRECDEWFAIAQEDLSSAEFLQGKQPTPIRVICFHCQQAAEKMLKGFLSTQQAEPKKIHDLIILCKDCCEFDDGFEQLMDACSELTDYGVQTRYPYELDLNEQDMQSALQHAYAIRDFVECIMMQENEDETESFDGQGFEQSM